MGFESPKKSEQPVQVKTSTPRGNAGGLGWSTRRAQQLQDRIGNQALMRLIESRGLLGGGSGLDGRRENGAGPISAGRIPYAAEMTKAFGRDFSKIKIATGERAGLQRVGASAGTDGHQITFASSQPDRRTVAHELAHVIQYQKASTDLRSVPPLSRPGDPAEREAVRVADIVARGGSPGPVVEAPGARFHRDDDPVCEPPPQASTGTFELDPALTDLAIPANLTAHVRVSQPMFGGRGVFRDRFVELVRPVRSAAQLTAYAVPRDQVSLVGVCTEEPVPLAAGDQAETPSGTITITGVEGDTVFTAQPNGDTVAAGAIVFLETDAGTVVIDAGLQAIDPQFKEAVGLELGRQVGERTGGRPVGEAILAVVTADGPALPYIATRVGLRSIRATQDLYDDGTIARTLAAQNEYREWYQAALRERLVAERSTWEATQPISPNQGIRDQLWEAHLASTIASTMREVTPPEVRMATEVDGVLQGGGEAAPVPATPVSAEIPDVSDTQWEPVDDQWVFIYGGGQLAMVPSRGLVLKPATGARAATTVAPAPAPTEVPNLQPSGSLGLGPAPARPVTPWMVLQTIGKQSHVIVRTNVGLALMVDAGGPRAIATRGFANASSRLGGVAVETILVTHEHSDHVRQLLNLIETHRIPPENLVLSEAWTEVVDALRTTTRQSLVDLGYGTDWTGPRVATGTQPVTYSRIRSGTVDVDIYALRDAHRDYAAARANEAAGGPQVRSSAGDRASLLYVFGNESSSNRTLFLGDFRGDNVVELHRELGAERFRAAFRNVRTVVGVGHHFSRAAGRTATDVRGLDLLLEATLVQNGELTILVQSRTGFAFDGAVTMAGPEGALLRYFVRQGARVVFVGEGRGSAVVDTASGVSTQGTGVEVISGDPRLVEMYRRLAILREARRTVAESAEFGPSALEMDGRSAAEIQASLDNDIARLEGLARELRGHSGADLIDVRGPEEPRGRGTSRSRVSERQAYRDANTSPGRTADQIVEEMARVGPAEQALSAAVRERLRLAVASGRSVALGVEFAHTPTEVITAIEGLPAAQRSALARQYRELTDLTGRLESGLVPPGEHLEVLARAMVLRDGLTAALAATTGTGRMAVETELARLNDVIGRLEAGTVRHVEVGRDIEGRTTRTEYLRMRQGEAIVRGFHNLGRAMGAMMVVHTVSELGAITDAAARGDLTLPEGAFRVAHAAYGMNIGVRLARSTFRQAMTGTGPRVRGWEFAVLAVLEIGAAATASYETTEERDAAILGTSIHASVNLICMYAGTAMMGWGAKLPHPYAKLAVMGLGLALTMAGDKILNWFGLDERVQRWTSFPPGEVTEVHQNIDAALRQYRILIGTQQLGGRSDAELTGLGLTDPARVRELTATTGDSAAREARSKERELTTLFENAYRRARGSWVGLQILDQQAEEFTRLRRMAMSGRDDPGRAALDARWRALDASLDLSAADEATIRGMEQWGSIDQKRSEVAAGLAEQPIDFHRLFESMEELQLMVDNARYRIDSPGRPSSHGVLRPHALIPTGTSAYRVYRELLDARESQLAALHRGLMRASGSGLESELNDSTTDPQKALANLRAIRRAYDTEAAAASAENPALALPATWSDSNILARACVTAYRNHGQTFQRLRLTELTLQSAGRQAEFSLTAASAPPPEAFRRAARTEIDAVPNAIFARRETYGLVYPHELDTVLEQRGAAEDAILAARMDAAFPRSQESTTRPVPRLTETEIEALHSGDLASVGRPVTTTERQLGEARRVVGAGRTIGSDLATPGPRDYLSGNIMETWNLMSRSTRQFAVLNSSYRIVDFEWNDTYPLRTVPAGRTPIIALLYKTHWGCDSEYCFGGPAIYHQVIGVNADAIAQLGPEPVFVHGFRVLSNEEVEQRLGSNSPP